MKYFICVGHANYGGGVISSADGTSKGGVNEYKYNKELAPYVCKWLKAAGHEATLCIAPEGQLHSLNDEIKYFIEEEHKQNYDLSVQLHLNAFNGEAYGCEALLPTMQMDFRKPSGSVRSSVLSGMTEELKNVQVCTGPERPRQKLS